MEAIIRTIPIYYEEYGAGRPVLMLHGWPTDHRHKVADFEPLFQNRSGWRRIYPDLPGMGRTPGAEWITHQDHMLEVVTEFMQVLAPGERFVVIGTSYGGYLARGLVHRQGDMIDGVLLLVPLIDPGPAKQNNPPPQVLIEDPAMLAMLTPEEDYLRNAFVVQSPEALESFRTVIVPAFAAADHDFLNRVRQNMAFSFPVDEVVTPFPAPALIITGRQDSVCGYRDAWSILENYPRATFAVLDRAGHGLGDEQKALFQALTSEWLDRVEEHRARASV